MDLEKAVTDLGDLPCEKSWLETARGYRRFTESLLREPKIPFFAGGDHAVTVPVVEALALLDLPIHVIQMDAHPDLYPEFEGSRSSHACVAARLLEMKHVASLSQLGIRTMNADQKAIADQYGDRLWVQTARRLPGPIPQPPQIPEGAAVYLTVDLDAFDPAFAPGVSHPVPGGLTPRQALNFIQDAAWRLIAMDAVEINPSLDRNNCTAVLGARLLHEGMGLARRQSDPDRFL